MKLILTSMNGAPSQCFQLALFYERASGIYNQKHSTTLKTLMLVACLVVGSCKSTKDNFYEQEKMH